MNTVLNPGELVPLIALSIPILAITGGIVAGIVKLIGNQRMRELAHRERIAALERGVDVSQLPPLPAVDPEDVGAESPSRTARGLLVGGLVTAAAGIGLAFMLAFLEPNDTAWAIGALPFSIGVALLLAGWFLRPRNSGR